MGQKDDESTLPILVVKDHTSGPAFAHAVPCKSDLHPYPVNQMVREIETLGWKKLILKSDQESAMVEVAQKVKEKRLDETLIEESPVGASASNGTI